MATNASGNIPPVDEEFPLPQKWQRLKNIVNTSLKVESASPDSPVSVLVPRRTSSDTESDSVSPLRSSFDADKRRREEEELPDLIEEETDTPGSSCTPSVKARGSFDAHAHAHAHGQARSHAVSSAKSKDRAMRVYLEKERRARAAYELALAELAPTLPEVLAREEQHDGRQLEQQVRWLCIELEAFKEHVTALQLVRARHTQLLTRLRAATSQQPPTALGRRMIELQAAQKRMDELLACVDASRALEKQENDHLEEMLSSGDAAQAHLVQGYLLKREADAQQFESLCTADLIPKLTPSARPLAAAASAELRSAGGGESQWWDRSDTGLSDVSMTSETSDVSFMSTPGRGGDHYQYAYSQHSHMSLSRSPMRDLSGSRSQNERTAGGGSPKAATAAAAEVLVTAGGSVGSGGGGMLSGLNLFEKRMMKWSKKPPPASAAAGRAPGGSAEEHLLQAAAAVEDYTDRPNELSEQLLLCIAAVYCRNSDEALARREKDSKDGKDRDDSAAAPGGGPSMSPLHPLWDSLSVRSTPPTPDRSNESTPTSMSSMGSDFTFSRSHSFDPDFLGKVGGGTGGSGSGNGSPTHHHIPPSSSLPSSHSLGSAARPPARSPLHPLGGGAASEHHHYHHHHHQQQQLHHLKRTSSGGVGARGGFADGNSLGGGSGPLKTVHEPFPTGGSPLRYDSALGGRSNGGDGGGGSPGLRKQKSGHFSLDDFNPLEEEESALAAAAVGAGAGRAPPGPTGLTSSRSGGFGRRRLRSGGSGSSGGSGVGPGARGVPGSSSYSSPARQHQQLQQQQRRQERQSSGVGGGGGGGCFSDSDSEFEDDDDCADLRQLLGGGDRMSLDFAYKEAVLLHEQQALAADGPQAAADGDAGGGAATRRAAAAEAEAKARARGAAMAAAQQQHQQQEMSLEDFLEKSTYRPPPPGPSSSSAMQRTRSGRSSRRGSSLDLLPPPAEAREAEAAATAAAAAADVAGGVGAPPKEATAAKSAEEEEQDEEVAALLAAAPFQVTYLDTSRVTTSAVPTRRASIDLGRAGGAAALAAAVASAGEPAGLHGEVRAAVGGIIADASERRERRSASYRRSSTHAIAEGEIFSIEPSIPDAWKGLGSTLLDPYGVLGEHPCPTAGKYGAMVEVGTPPAAGTEGVRAPQDAAALVRFKALAAQLEPLSPDGLSADQKLAFWINLYNALLMHTFIMTGVPRNQMRRVALMGRASFMVGGLHFTALTIEQTVLRACSHRPSLSKLLPVQKFKPSDERSRWVLTSAEPLVSFGLVNGCKSSPALRVYTGAGVRQELERAMDDYLLVAVGVHGNDKIVVPKVLDWYGRDFAPNHVGLLNWLVQRLPCPQQTAIADRLPTNPKVTAAKCMTVVPFDWSFRYLIDPALAARV